MPKTDSDAELAASTKPRTNSKSAAVVALLRRSEGATLDEVTTATGWQKHTARAPLTGLKKKGHTIERVKTEGVSRYHITSGADV